MSTTRLSQIAIVRESFKTAIFILLCGQDWSLLRGRTIDDSFFLESASTRAFYVRTSGHWIAAAERVSFHSSTAEGRCNLSRDRRLRNQPCVTVQADTGAFGTRHRPITEQGFCTWLSCDTSGANKRFHVLIHHSCVIFRIRSASARACAWWCGWACVWGREAAKMTAPIWEFFSCQERPEKKVIRRIATCFIYCGWGRGYWINYNILLIITFRNTPPFYTVLLSSPPLARPPPPQKNTHTHTRTPPLSNDQKGKPWQLINARLLTFPYYSWCLSTVKRRLRWVRNRKTFLFLE